MQQGVSYFNFGIIYLLVVHLSSKVDMSEWLRSVTRNHMGSARTGSNPVVDATFFLNFFGFAKFFKAQLFYVSKWCGKILFFLLHIGYFQSHFYLSTWVPCLLIHSISSFFFWKLWQSSTIISIHARLLNMK